MVCFVGRRVGGFDFVLGFWRVVGVGLAWQVFSAPWMFPATICDFSSDMSFSVSTSKPAAGASIYVYGVLRRATA